MAKFCTNCGRKLNDGEKCDCTPSAMYNLDVQKLLDICKGMFIKPIDTMKDFAKKSNFNLAMVLVGILAVVTGLFTMSMMKNAYSMVTASMGSGYYSYGISANLPYAKTFFIVLVTLFALSFIYVGILYLVNSKIFKRAADFKEVYALYGVTSIINSVVLLVSSVLMFLNVTFAFIVTMLGFMLSAVYSYHGIKFLGDKDENKYGYIYLTTNVIFYVVIFIITKIFS